MPSSSTCVIESSGGAKDVIWAWDNTSHARAGLDGSVAINCGAVTTVAVYTKTVRDGCTYYAPVGFCVIVADSKMKTPTERCPLYDAFEGADTYDRTLSGLFRPQTLVDFGAHAEEYDRRFYEWLSNPKAFIREGHGLDHTSFQYVYRKGKVPAGDGLSFDALTGTRDEIAHDWEKAVALAAVLIGAKTATEKVHESTACVALTLLAGPYPGFSGGENIHKKREGQWSETYDSRGHPLFDFYSNKDCDGKALAVCSFWKLVKKYLATPEGRKGLTPRADKAAETITGNYVDCGMAHVMVDLEIARGSPGKRHRLTPASLDGHCIAVLLKEKKSMKDMLVCDGCNCMMPHVPPSWRRVQKEVLYRTQFEDRSHVGGYSTVDLLDGYEEIRAVYGEGWFLINKGAPKMRQRGTPNYTWDDAALAYVENDAATENSIFDANGTLKTNPFGFAAAASGAAEFAQAPRNTEQCRRDLAQHKNPVVKMAELARISRALTETPLMEWDGTSFAALDRGAGNTVLPSGPNVVKVSALVQYAMYWLSAIRDHGTPHP